MYSEIEVTVVMPVYNAEAYLTRAIESVLNQKFEQFELILINDGSTDNSLEICRGFAKKDKRIKLISKKNEGICATRNLGIEKASGKYITFIDNDDVMDSNTLLDNLKIAKVMGAEIVKYGYRFVEELEANSFNNIGNHNVEIITSERKKEKYMELFRNDNLIFVWDALFSADLIKRNRACFDLNFKNGHEDIVFCNQLYMDANVIAINKDIYYNHVVIKTSASHRFNKKQIAATNKLLEVQKDVARIMELSRDEWCEIMARSIVYLINYLSYANKKEYSFFYLHHEMDSFYKNNKLIGRLSIKKFTMKNIAKYIICFLYQHGMIFAITAMICLKRLLWVK